MYINKSKDYVLEYAINSYKIKEQYHKDKKVYYINIYNDDTDYAFYLMKKYSNARKIVKDINVEVKDEYTCVKPIISNYELNAICQKDKVYYVEKFTVNEEKKLETSNSIDIYDKNFTYYIWNGYGLENILTKKKIDIFKEEHYDNILSYKTDDLIIFANYDEERTFTKFYVFNTTNEKIFTILSDDEISYDSYYLGIVKNKLYLFDKKNMHEYAINLKKLTVEKIDKDNIGQYYDNGFKKVELSKFKYNDLTFKKQNIINYGLENNILSKEYDNSNNKIIVTPLNVKDIIFYDDDIIYYLSDSSLYAYTEEKGNQLLLQNFEWKFSYLNRIFIFNNK